MFTKDGILYADTFKYLRHKRRSEVALQIKAEAEDFIEVDMESLNVEIKGDMIGFSTWFVVRPDSFDYGDIKKAVIQMRYSNDDQMALMLNKDDSEEKAILFQKMQEWRGFATAVAKEAVEKLG